MEPADAKIRNRIVPPGGTLVADAETVTEGLAGADLDGVGVPERAGLGVGLLVLLGTGADGVTAGPDDPAGLDGAAGGSVADRVAGADAWLAATAWPTPMA